MVHENRANRERVEARGNHENQIAKNHQVISETGMSTIHAHNLIISNVIQSAFLLHMSNSSVSETPRNASMEAFARRAVSVDDDATPASCRAYETIVENCGECRVEESAACKS